MTAPGMHDQGWLLQLADRDLAVGSKVVTVATVARPCPPCPSATQADIQSTRL